MEKRDQFDSSGQVKGYISLDQAMLLARQRAREDAQLYRRRLGWEEIVWSELSSEQREDTYRVVLQFRRPARLVREEQTGEEEFVFDLTGKLEFRQVLAWPEGAESAPPPPAAPPAEEAVPRPTTPPPMGEVASIRTQPTERGRKYQSFFQEVLVEIKRARPGITRSSRVGYDNWLSTPSGKAGFAFELVFASRARFDLQLYIDVGNRDYNKHAYGYIYDGKDTVEEELGAELSWQRLENRRASRVAWYWNNSVTIMDPPEKLDRLKAWCVENYFKFRDVLSPYLENLPSSFEPDDLPEESQPAPGDLPTTGSA